MIDDRRDRRRAIDAPPSRIRQEAARLDLGARLVRLGLSANVLTATGVAMAAVFCVVVGDGYLWAGIALLISGGLMDTLDGLVAKSAGTASARGAFFDSVADRFSDGLMFGGLAWYLLVGHHPKYAALPIAIIVAGSVISYERAKAESLGFIAKGGLMERTERLIALGLALLFHVVMIQILWVTLVLTLITAITRFLRVWHQASGLPARIWIWRQSASHLSESRWRNWRESLGMERRIAIHVDDDDDGFGRIRHMFSSERLGQRRSAASQVHRKRTMTRRVNAGRGPSRNDPR